MLEANTHNYNSDKKSKFIQSLKIVKTKKSKKICKDNRKNKQNSGKLRGKHRK